MQLRPFRKVHGFSFRRLQRRSQVYFTLEMFSGIVFRELVPCFVILEMELRSCSVFLEVKGIAVALVLELISGCTTLELPSSGALVAVKRLAETLVVKLFRIRE
jgi:hypothetical protein